MYIRNKQVKDNWTYSTKYAGNWQKFESFGWQHAYDGELIEPQRYTIVNVLARDSDILTESNADEIKKIMKWYLDHGYAHLETHYHWLCGWCEAIVMPVYTLKGKVSRTFEYFVENVLKRLENYPVLNEEDFSQREYDQQLENIRVSLYWFERKNDLELSDSNRSSILDNLWESVISGQDSDYYPTNEDIESAIADLGIELV